MTNIVRYEPGVEQKSKHTEQQILKDLFIKFQTIVYIVYV